MQTDMDVKTPKEWGPWDDLANLCSVVTVTHDYDMGLQRVTAVGPGGRVSSVASTFATVAAEVVLAELRLEK